MSTTHLKLLLLVGGSYGWEVVGGRTFSPFPQVHSTSGLILLRGKGKHQGTLPLSHSPWFCSSSRTGWMQRHFLLTFSCTGFFIIFLMHEAGETVIVTHDFPVHEPFTLRRMCVCVFLSPTCALVHYVFPYLG